VKLKRLAIQRLPGINAPFAIEAAGAGVHVVVGPNGVGKSSLCRAVEGLYWADLGAAQRTTVQGEFELDGEAWWAEHEGGRVRWQRGGEDSAPPSLPASHNHRHFFLRLRDLIDPSPGGTQDIAAEIRRQMSGGFDLDRIADDLFGGIGARHGHSQRSEFNKASQDVQEAEGRQSGLQAREDKLDALKEQLEAARSTGSRRAAISRALELAERRQEYAQILEELAVLPAGLANLIGDERERIDGSQKRIDGLSDRARDFAAQRDAARDAKRDCRLSEPLSRAELDIWRERANQLGRLEMELQAARDERTQCQAELATRLAALGGGEINEVDLDLADHHQLFEFLRDAVRHKDAIDAIEERLRLLAEIEHSAADQTRLDDYRRGVDALRSWLRAPEPQSASLPSRSRTWWMLSGLAVIASGLGLAFVIDPLFAALAAFGAGLALAATLWGGRRAQSGARESARTAFARLDIGVPETWDLAAVDARLRDLESDISRMERSRDRAVDRQALNSQLAGLSEAGVALDARRQTLADSLRLAEVPPDAELVDYARALDAFDAARVRDERAASRVESLEAKQEALLSDLTDNLERHGEAQPADSTAALAHLNSLVDRSSRLAQALSDERAAVKGLQQNSVDRGEASDAMTQVFAKAGLDNGDLRGLEALLNSLPEYQKLKPAAARVESQMDLYRRELETAGESGLAVADEPTLDGLLNELSRVADEEEGLRNEIAEIDLQVKDAKAGSTLQALMARQDEARAALQDRRDEALFAHAGQFLIDAVETEYEQTQMPRVFESARDHLSAFTHHSYELRLGKEAMFAIEQQSGEGRQLEELSDGTRAQLLLAARIAFAEEVEQGKTLPLFLDEALDQSDPDRFNAIMRSLGQLAKDQDRQIFYLTSDPVDVERIRQALAAEGCDIAATIDLGLIRRNAASIDDAGALRIAPRPEVPLPGDMSAADYGAALGVPAFSPQAGHEPQHVFYLMPDALDQLRGFLVAGIERAGQWRTASDTVLAAKLCAGALPAEEITARGTLLEHFCALWKQGRGRPVDRDALEHSGAVSNTFIDKVAAVTDDLGGNAESLLAALDAKKDARLKGFRRSSQDSLEAYLQSEGYLDDRPLLSESELRLQAMATPAANALPNDNAADLLHRWWAWAMRASDADAQQ
jgi:DNA repair protein SbcC/Rad50